MCLTFGNKQCIFKDTQTEKRMTHLQALASQAYSEGQRATMTTLSLPWRYGLRLYDFMIDTVDYANEPELHDIMNALEVVYGEVVEDLDGYHYWVDVT